MYANKYDLIENLTNAIDSLKASANLNNTILIAETESGIHRNITSESPNLTSLLREAFSATISNGPQDVISLYINEIPSDNSSDGYRLRFEFAVSGNGLSNDNQTKLRSLLLAYGVKAEVESDTDIGFLITFSMLCSSTDTEVLSDISTVMSNHNISTDSGSIADISHRYDDENASSDSSVNASDNTADKSSDSAPVVTVDADSLPAIPDIMWDYALMLSNDPSIAFMTAQQFYKGIDTSKSNIDELYKNIQPSDGGSFQGYQIAVHGMKGASAAFGAMQLFGLCRLLEFAARAFDYERIKALHPILMDELIRVKTDWAELNPKSSEDLPQMDDPIYIKELIRQLKYAMEIMDMDAADEIAETLSGYSYSELVCIPIEKIIDGVNSIEYDSVTAECDSLLSLLGD